MTTFTAERVTHTYTQHLLAAPDAVSPLLCPVREAEWLDGWDYEMVYSASGYAEEGCVFTSKQIGEPDGSVAGTALSYNRVSLAHLVTGGLEMKRSTSPFKWRHFEFAIVLLGVWWYCRYRLSYRDLAER